jgi:hypothetical protein
LTIACTAGLCQSFGPDNVDAAEVRGLPSIGKWLIAPDLKPARWLGELYRSKQLREPINMIIIDQESSTSQEARARLLNVAAQAGFPSRSGHSGGYWAWIDHELLPQIPDTPSHAFSDEPYEFDNNHGRFFGPFPHQGRFIFVGALSRESVAPLSSPKHRYVSFNRARDKFADALDGKAGFRRSGFVSLANDLADSRELTTGDHDGMAAVLTVGAP